MKSVFLFIYLFLAFIFPRLGPLNVVDVINVSIIFYFIYNKETKGIFNLFRDEILLMVSLVVLCTLSLCLNLIIQDSDVSIYYVYIFIRLITTFLASVLIVFNLSKKLTHSLATKFIPFVFFLHAVVIYFQIFNVFNLKEMLISLAVSMDSNLVEEYMLLIWRVPGFFGGYDSASVFSALGMVYLYLKKEINILIRYLIIILLFFTFFITARTGLFSLIMVALLTIMFKALSLRLKLGQLKVLIVSFSILATFFYINDNHLIVLPEEYEFVQSGINRLFEVFRNASTTGEIKTSSSDTLLKHHYHLPEDLKTLLIGNTFKSHQLGVYFFRSDVGYIELIYGGGLFVFSITCCLFLFMLKKVDRMKRNQFNSIFVFSLLIILLGMFKGKYLTSFHFINFVFFTYALTINNKLYEKK